MDAKFLHFAQEQYSALALIPLLPLIGFLVNGLGWVFLRDKWPRMLVNVIAVGVVALSFGLAANAFFILRSQPDTVLVVKLFDWLGAGDVSANFELVFDRLSAVMCLVVTGVGGLIHLYATGYMAHDKSFTRFFAYLNLFTFAMLLLVMGKNIVLMFVGWEGVGLCSYLLIGFWYESSDNASAGKKAFVVNRVGDFGFLVGIFLIVYITDKLGGVTLDFYKMADIIHGNAGAFGAATLVGVPVATLIGLSLFVGATGKSAQIPLYVWLPDAMAGPTPVSALIHAATMVTAGVYMIARLNFIYFFSPEALLVVAIIGVVTALFAATIGFTQNDIKKVLAYSTVSQLGYMFTAMGVAAYAAGVFHLVTHAFFKALLFLCAGSVIHGMHGDQDMRNMGGLKKYMPITCFTMAAGWLAIIGFPGLSGFMSKDEILWKAFSNDLHPESMSKLIYALGLIAAVCTAIYMTRLMYLTFFTPSRIDPKVEPKVHESPWNMYVPLIALAVLSVGGGLLNVPHALGGSSRFSAWLEPMWATGSEAAMTAPAPEGVYVAALDSSALSAETLLSQTEHGGDIPDIEEHGGEAAHAADGADSHGSSGHGEASHGGGHGGAVEPIEYILMGLSVFLALGAALVVRWLYLKHMDKTKDIADGLGPLYDASLNKYWVDEIYEATVIEPTKRVSYFFLFRIVDVRIVDGVVNGVGQLAKGLGEAGKRLQDGVIGTYAMFIALGLLAILAYFLGVF